MKKIIMVLLLFFAFINSIYAKEELIKHAKSAILIESSTGEVLYEYNMNEKRSPASMTKMMTMLLTMEALENGKIKLEDEVKVSKNASSMGGTQIFIEENSSVNVETLLKGIGIASANDAAVAIAEYIGGSESAFVNMMNEKAKSLGCKNTYFKNPHGLDEDGHYSSAYDLSLIARELIKYPYILKITSTYEDYINVSGDNHWLVNTNKLIRFYSGIDGLKTGYTDDAGYCLTATMERNGMRLISVVMKEDSKEDRNEDTISLMEYGFSTYGVKKIYDKDKYKGVMFIDNAKDRKVNYYLNSDVNLIVNKNSKDVKYSVKEKIYKIKAPINKGEKIGTLSVKYNNKNYLYDLVVKDSVKKSNYFEVMLNNLKDIITGVKLR